MLCAPYSLHTIDHQQYNVFTQLVQVAVHQVLRQMWSFRYPVKFSFVFVHKFYNVSIPSTSTTPPQSLDSSAVSHLSVSFSVTTKLLSQDSWRSFTSFPHITLPRLYFTLKIALAFMGWSSTLVQRQCRLSTKRIDSNWGNLFLGGFYWRSATCN